MQPVHMTQHFPTVFKAKRVKINRESYQDFIRWRASQDQAIPLIGDDPSLPDGMRGQSKVWGVWGAKGTIGGKFPGADITRMPACTDAEAQPAAPCANVPGGCKELLDDARRFEGAAKRSQQLMENALAAVQASQAMLMVATRKARDILKDEDFNMSRLAEEDASKQNNMQAKILWGPWMDPAPPYTPYHHEDWMQTEEMKKDMTHDIGTRLREREELDRRAVEYLNLVEAQTSGPSSLSVVATVTLLAAFAPSERPIHGSCSEQKHVSRRARKCTGFRILGRKAQLEAFLYTR
jgi:hypothetical protein